MVAADDICIGKRIVLSKLYNIFRFFYDYLPDSIVNALNYYHVFRRFPNIKSPKRYTEKIQWYKLNGGLENYTSFADKYEVRSFVASRVGEKYLTPLIGVWDHFEDIDFHELPRQFVLKLSHGSGYNIVCNDREKLCIELIENKIKNWQKENFYKIGRERQYKNCSPKIIVEKYLHDELDELIDYKIFCFNGKPTYIEVDFDRFSAHTRAFYDVHWNRLPFTTLYPLSDKNLQRPDNLDELLQIAKELSRGFLHVRVDLYNPDGHVFFGELTFTHGNGFEPFYPDEWDILVGNQFVIT